MSQIIQLPAHLQRRAVAPSSLGRDLAAGLGGTTPPYISIEGNRFTFVDGSGNKKPWDRLTIQVVILDANPNVSKVYYDVAYDPAAENFTAPACWSDNGVGPSSQAQKPQANTCASCPQNVWGSAMSRQTGKATKACNDIKKIAVMVPDFENRVFLLRIPPASLKNLKQYAAAVGSWSDGQRSVEPSDLLTTVEFESQGVIRFQPAGFVTEEQLDVIDQIAQSKVTDDLVGRNDTPRQGAIAPQQKAQELPAPAFQPAPVQPQPPAFQPAPVQPQPPAFQPAPVQPQPPAFQPQPFPQPADQKKAAYAAQFPPIEAPKPRGRPKKEAEPSFMASPEVYAPPAPAPNAQFGMATPTPADEALLAAVRLAGG